MADSPTIRAWLEEGKRKGATHMVVVCDTFDHEDYPVYVMPGGDARKTVNEYSGKSMQRVMECYSLKKNIAAQLAEFRAYHYD
jgi:hypothetical protein